MPVLEPTKRVVVAPATAADAAQFFDGVPPFRLRAWIGRVGETVLGLGGMYYLQDGTRVGFLILHPEGKRYPKEVLKASYAFLDTLRQEGIRNIRAVADPAIESAERFLLHLGFKADYSENDFTVYQWTPEH